MNITELKCNPETESARSKRVSLKFEELLSELRERLLPEEIISQINQEIDEINALTTSGKSLRKIIRSKQAKILKLLEKEVKLVTKNHYRNLWMAIGMAAFGIPIGAALGSSLGNMAFIGIGIPIGLTVGMEIGAQMDKKAIEEGRQLNFEVEI